MRLEIIEQDKMTAAQSELHARIAGARGAVGGAFNLWLYSPELCAKAEALCKFVRFDTSIPPKLRDIALLVTARHWDSSYMWHSYSQRALDTGVTPDAITAI